MVIQEADGERADAKPGSSKRRRFLTLPVVMHTACSEVGCAG